MLTRFALAALMGLGAAGPVGALTCLPLDLSRSYDWAEERPEAFVLGLGSLVRTGPDRLDGPASNDPNFRVSYRFPARFEGLMATSDGFTLGAVLDVTVEVDCRSAWCGGDSLSDHGLYFFRRDGEDSHALEAGLCGGFFFDNPSEDQVNEVLRRMR